MTIKKLTAFVLVAFVAVSAAGCKKENDTTDGKNNIPDGVEAAESVWFDDTFAVYYPEQLKDVADVIFSTVYYFGDTQTNHPAMCMCSDTVTDITLFAINEGVKGEVLYTVEKLEPMEAICIFPELADEASPNIGVGFTDKDGVRTEYSIAKNADGNAVILSSFGV